MNMVPPRVALKTGSGNVLASASVLSRELYEIGAKLREASESYNRALNVKDDPRALINALIDFRANALKMLTLDQSLERKLITMLADDWENCKEVYRDAG